MLVRVKKRRAIGLRSKRRRKTLGSKKRINKRLKSRTVTIENPTYDNAYDNGHTEGYRKGYETGLQKGGEGAFVTKEQDSIYQAGYKKGLEVGKYDGGDAIIDRLLPGQHILPDTSTEQIIASGIAALEHRFVSLLSVDQVGERILQALEKRSPLSIVRLGDGELLALAQETVMSIDQVRQEGEFLAYAGIHVPDLAVRDRLLEAVKRAGIVGIPVLRQRNYQPLAAAVFQAYGIDFREREYTDSLVNYSLFKTGYLQHMMQGRRVLVIGNLAERLAAVLSAQGVAVAGVISPVHGTHDADRVTMLAQQFDFELALVSAGISAVLITEEIARVMGKVALDFGHMADSLIKGEANLN
ncbi:MAG: GT-D fold domain-containing glycosyltransferase [Candidatus Pristimantibacillus sp.]